MDGMSILITFERVLPTKRYKVQDVRPGDRDVSAGRRRGWLPCHTEVTLVQRNRCRDTSDRTRPMDYLQAKNKSTKKLVYAQPTQTCEITECQGDINTHSVQCIWGSSYPTPHASAFSRFCRDPAVHETLLSSLQQWILFVTRCLVGHGGVIPVRCKVPLQSDYHCPNLARTSQEGEAGAKGHRLHLCHLSR